MSKPAEVFDAFFDALSGYTILAGYVKQFLQGDRDPSSITLFPTVIVDYANSDESDSTYGRVRVTMKARLLIYIQVYNQDKQIVGDANTKGALDIINDIKKAIDADRTLGGKALLTTIKSDALVTLNFPIRVITLTADILFEQDETIRS